MHLSSTDGQHPRRKALMLFALPLAAGMIWLWWPGAVSHIASENYLPHGYCYLWNRQLLSLHVISDSAIFLSYLAISITMAWLVLRERKRIPFSAIFAAFGLFIIACGFTHGMDVLVLWRPFYWLAGDIKAVTAVASIVTAIALVRMIPQIQTVLRKVETSATNERRFLAAAATSNDSFYILEAVRDPSGQMTDFRFAFVNNNGALLLSSTPEQLQGKLLCETLPVNRSDGFFDKYKQVVETGQRLEDEFPIHAPGIQATWLRYQVMKLEDGVAITTTNISAFKQNEQRLTRLSSFAQSITASSPFATIVTDSDGMITSFNPAAERMLWYTRNELIDLETPVILLDPQCMIRRAASLSDELRQPIEPGLAVLDTKAKRGLVDEAEWTLVRRDGSHVDAQLTISPLLDPDGQIVGLTLIAYDITERKREQEYISHIAHHDALTGLPTRILFQDRLMTGITRANRDQNKVAVLMIDLDNFKRINDALGHHVGDETLMQVAARLRKSVRESDTVARMGGDEFVVVLDGIRIPAEAEAVAAKILRDLQKPLDAGGQQVTPGGSIGISLYPDNGDSVETLLQSADVAMYEAKAGGRNRFCTFNTNLAFAASRKRTLEAGLAQALELGELEMYYQPQVSMTTGKVTGVEALMRWNSKRLGRVTPGEFIPLIEENGLIIPIGEWMIRQVCSDGNRLRESLGRKITIALNISPRQLQNENLPRVVSRALADFGLDAGSLELEITESILVSDSAPAMAILGRLRSLGVRVSIDDFGTGFSSMSYVLRFSVDSIKIDRSFVSGMATDSNCYAVVSAVINLAKGLNITVIAEGLETLAQHQILLERGCDQAQGFLYSKPEPFEQILNVIHAIESVESSTTTLV